MPARGDSTVRILLDDDGIVQFLISMGIVIQKLRSSCNESGS